MPELDDSLTWKGAWAAGVDYVIDDAVLDGFDLVYVCIADHTSALANRPPFATDWEPLVEAPLEVAYASVSAYHAIAGPADDSDDVAILSQLKAVSRLWERETGQFFTKDETPTVRIFLAKWSDVLELNYEGKCPGIATTDGLEIKVDTDGDGSFADETAWATTDYDLFPLQADAGPEPVPWDCIKVRRGSNKSFRPGYKVQVTAVFGWPAVPEAVSAAVIELCRIWRAESPRATGRMLELDQVVRTSATAQDLINRFKHAYPAAVTF